MESPPWGATPTYHRKLQIMLFRALNRGMLAFWRLGLGTMLNAWPSVGGRLMVLVTTGRKTGRMYRTPLNYAEVDGDVYCLAGFGSRADWYRNALTNPTVELWLPDGWWQAEAEDVSEGPDRLRLMRAVLIGSGFAAYVAGFRPRTMSDLELATRTEPYRLLRLRRTSPRTGGDGPGNRAAVWPLLACLLGYLLLRRRALRRHRLWLLDLGPFGSMLRASTRARLRVATRSGRP